MDNETRVIWAAILDLFDANQEQIASALVLAFVLALVSAFLVEPIMYSIGKLFGKTDEWVDNYKAIAFFIVDFVLLMLSTSFNETALSVGNRVFVVVIISALSAGIYYYFPSIINWFRRWRFEHKEKNNNG